MKWNEIGWESNTQYAYEYNGRVATGIKDLKQQWGIAQINGLVSVQTLKEGSLIVKVIQTQKKAVEDSCLSSNECLRIIVHQRPRSTCFRLRRFSVPPPTLRRKYQGYRYEMGTH